MLIVLGLFRGGRAAFIIIIACSAVGERETIVEGDKSNLLTGVSPLRLVGEGLGENVSSHLTGLAIVQDKSFVSEALVQPRNVDSVNPVEVFE